MINNLIQETYNEVIKELQAEFGNDVSLTHQDKDMALGEIATQLAQAKGELNTILDRSAREGVIKKEGGKVKILNKEEYIKRIGILPKRIKELQQRLEN